jgi:hypothetical protein
MFFMHKVEKPHQTQLKKAFALTSSLIKSKYFVSLIMTAQKSIMLTSGTYCNIKKGELSETPVMTF